MSNRTLVEFNHDQWFKIEADPQGFADAVLELLRAGSAPRTVEALERYGVTCIGTRHHSEPASVEYRHHKVVVAA